MTIIVDTDLIEPYIYYKDTDRGLKNIQYHHFFKFSRKRAAITSLFLYDERDDYLYQLLSN